MYCSIYLCLAVELITFLLGSKYKNIIILITDHHWSHSFVLNTLAMSDEEEEELLTLLFITARPSCFAMQGYRK